MVSTRASISLSDPGALLHAFTSRLASHGIEVREVSGSFEIVFGGSTVRAAAGGEALDIVIEAADISALRQIRSLVAQQIVEFAPKGVIPEMRWIGDGLGAALPPEFRVLTVTHTEQVTPHMRRVHFSGEDLARFASTQSIHVRLYIPPEGLAEPVWPIQGEDGLTIQPPPDKRPVMRKYTIRQIDAPAGTLAIDFVLHDDAGPGSGFAARARPGDRIGMTGPGGRGLKPAQRYVLLGDETSLPAIGRMLESLPADAQGLAVIEVADAGEEQVLTAPAGIAVRWVHRHAVPAGSPSGLEAAFAALDFAEDGPETYVWSATEHEVFKRLRASARQRLRPERDQHLIVSYWRAGMAEEQHAAEKRAAAQAA